MNRRTLATYILLALAPGFAAAETANVHEGDTWTYRTTTEKGQTGWTQTRDEVRVSRVTATTIYYAMHAVGSTQAPTETLAGADWSRKRNVDGVETIVNRPFDFPLQPGKTWNLSYTEQHPSNNPKLRSETWDHHYTVVGPETIDVPAGHFDAIKVEEEGTWTGVPEPSQSVVQTATTSRQGAAASTVVAKAPSEPVAGRTYKAFWYVPAVHRWVKSIEEYYGPSGVRNERYTQELEAFETMK